MCLVIRDPHHFSARDSDNVHTCNVFQNVSHENQLDNIEAAFQLFQNNTDLPGIMCHFCACLVVHYFCFISLADVTSIGVDFSSVLKCSDA